MNHPGDKLIVKRARTGLGLFAARAIPAGRRIVEYVGPVVTTEEVNRRGGRYFFAIDDDYSIDGSSRANVARYVNHSCRPNAVAYVSSRRRIWVWARKNIKAGEEITIDYGRAYFDEHIKPVGCKCEACSAAPAKKRRARR